MKKTVVLGATPNPARYAYLATKRLKQAGHEVIPIGIKKGEIEGIAIQNVTLPLGTAEEQYKDVDTVTLYLNPDNQKPYYDYIFSLHPKRLIFNPGTENFDLKRKAEQQGIETEYACTLVLLSLDEY